MSLVASYCVRFNRILQAGSHAELLRRLRARLEESAASPNGRPPGR